METPNIGEGIQAMKVQSTINVVGTPLTQQISDELTKVNCLLTAILHAFPPSDQQAIWKDFHALLSSSNLHIVP